MQVRQARRRAPPIGLRLDCGNSRPPDLLDSAVAEVTADKQNGSYRTHHPREAMLFVDGLDMIARVSVQSSMRS